MEKYIRDYLGQAEVMQLATTRDNQPWACTVHFWADGNTNIYWFSNPERRHSQDIAANAKAAVAIAVKTAWPVIGVQIEGDAALVTDPAEIERAVRAFDARHHRGQAFVDGVLSGEGPQKPYRLTLRLIQLFDMQNFPKDSPQILRLA